jgi:hypothetical protein
LQVKSQALALQTAVALAGVVHAAHVLLHFRKPELHAKPQALPSQAETALATVGHAVHELPQLVSPVFAVHAWPQMCWPVGQEQTRAVGLQAAPVGHSDDTLQPTEHTLEMGSQPNPGAQAPAATQSVGSGWQVPMLQTCPEPQRVPQGPQLFSSLSVSIHRLPQ